MSSEKSKHLPLLYSLGGSFSSSDQVHPVWRLVKNMISKLPRINLKTCASPKYSIMWPVARTMKSFHQLAATYVAIELPATRSLATVVNLLLICILGIIGSQYWSDNRSLPNNKSEKLGMYILWVFLLDSIPFAIDEIRRLTAQNAVSMKALLDETVPPEVDQLNFADGLSKMMLVGMIMMHMARVATICVFYATSEISGFVSSMTYIIFLLSLIRGLMTGIGVSFSFYHMCQGRIVYVQFVSDILYKLATSPWDERHFRQNKRDKFRCDLVSGVVQEPPIL